MRVLIAHNRYRVAGGEERHIDFLHEGLLSTGHEVMRFDRSSTELEHAPLKRLLAGLALAYRPGGGGIERTVDSWRPDIVHFHNVWPLLTPAAMRLVHRRGIAVVLTAHNYRFACPAGACPSTARDRCTASSPLLCALTTHPCNSFVQSAAYGVAIEIQRRCAMLQRWVNAFIAPSAFVGRKLRENGFRPEAIHVIPHGLPEQRVLPQRNEFVLYFGRVTHEKGIPTLIEAARLAPEIPIAVAGDGPLVDDVRASPIRHLGLLGPAGVADALGRAAFTVLPTELDENLPYSILESLGAGRAVVSTEVGGVSEVVSHEYTGLLVPPASPRALADALRRLWHNSELAASLGANASEMVRTRFSLGRQISATTAIYETLL